MQWFHISNLNEMPTIDLYQILKLRQDIFIIEQNCNYHDIDNIDTESEHIYLKEDGEIISYSRIVPAGIKFDRPSIGRIVVKKTYRGNGYGKEIVRRCLKILSKRGVSSVFIEAQSHLESFYESVGFKKMSDAYPVDGISHIKMVHNFIT